MNTFARIAITAICACLLATSVIYAQGVCVILDVKRQSSQKQTKVNWQTSWGSSDKDISRSLTISVTVRNVGTNTIEGALEWYFLAKGLRSKDVWIFDQDYTRISLPPQGLTNITVKSESIDSYVTQYSHGDNTKAGNTIDGYIVRLAGESNMLAVEASSKVYEVLGNDAAKFQSLLEKSTAKKGKQDYYYRWYRRD